MVKKKDKGEKPDPHSWKAFFPWTKEHKMLVGKYDPEEVKDARSWKAFFPFTAEGKAMRRKKKRAREDKPKKEFHLEQHLTKAGFEGADTAKLKKVIFRFSLAAVFLFSLYLIYRASGYGKDPYDLLWVVMSLWLVVFPAFLMIIGFAVSLYLDLRMYKRTKEVEAVLPDFLQLASANISAGMPLDRALWFAVRPNFGILAKEIEEVAKATYAGHDLKDALNEFAGRYDSKTLQRSISLILEGMAAGGEMAELLNKIALNIEETNIQKKEMAANVTTYVIFIGMATVFGAPVLFGLATQLLTIIQGIMGNMGSGLDGASSTIGFSLSVGGDAIAISDFKTYSYAMLAVSSFFSGAIISVIRKGNIKEGAMLIPGFMVATLILYHISNWILSIMLGAFI